MNYTILEMGDDFVIVALKTYKGWRTYKFPRLK